MPHIKPGHRELTEPIALANAPEERRLLVSVDTGHFEPRIKIFLEARLDPHHQIWPDLAMKRVKIAELKDHLSAHLRAVERGAIIEVTDRERPIARIVPAPDTEEPAKWRRAKRPFSTIRNRKYPEANLPLDIVDILLEDRHKR